MSIRRALETVFFTGILALYLATLCPTVYWYDSGEFITAAALLDIAHPPGYPLYCLLGRLFSLLPANEPAWGVNLLSALAGWGVLFLLYIYSRGILSTPVPPWRKPSEPLLTLLSLVPPAIIGLSLDFWNVATFAENYTLDLLLWLLLLCVFSLVRGARGLWLVSFFLGLLLAARTTNVMFLLLLLPALRWRFQPSRKETLLGGVFFVLSLSLLLYLPLAADLARLPHQGAPESWAGFLSVVSASSYGAYLSLTPGEIVRRAVDLVSHLCESFTPFGCLFLAAALVGLKKWRLPLLPLGFFLIDAGVKLCFTAQVIQGHFYLTAVIFLSLYFAPGLWRLLSYRKIKGRLVISGVLLAALVIAGLFNYPLVDKRRYRRAYVYARILLNLPREPGARLLCGGDNDYQTTRYLHHVLGERADLELAHASLLAEDDLRRWLSEYSSVPVYLSFYNEDLVDRLGLGRWGPLWAPRLAPRAISIPRQAPRVVFGGQIALRGCTATVPSPGLPLLRLRLSWETGAAAVVEGKTVWLSLTDREGGVIYGGDGVPFCFSYPLLAGGVEKAGAYLEETLVVVPPGVSAGSYHLALALSETAADAPRKAAAAEQLLGNYLRDNPRTVTDIGFNQRLFAAAQGQNIFIPVTDAAGMRTMGNFCLAAEVDLGATW